jgi:hypothetical protein
MLLNVFGPKADADDADRRAQEPPMSATSAGHSPKVVVWAVIIGIFQALSPLAFWWLDPRTLWAVALAVIAAVYVGFAVADGRPKVIAAEVGVAFAFVILATVAAVSSPWLMVLALVAHGLKDLGQHRSHFVANTRWWPPFCLVVDFVAAAVIAVLLLAGIHLHG